MFLRRGLQTATINRPDVLNRDGFLRIAGAGIIASAGAATVALAQSQARADYRLAIGRTSLELAPGHIVGTTAYNDRVPGPLIRVREGARVTIDVTNNSGSEDIVHWHGLGIPADVDGAMEEGSPMIRPGRNAPLQLHRATGRHALVPYARVRRSGSRAQPLHGTVRFLRHRPEEATRHATTRKYFSRCAGGSRAGCSCKICARARRLTTASK